MFVFISKSRVNSLISKGVSGVKPSGNTTLVHKFLRNLTSGWRHFSFAKLDIFLLIELFKLS